MLDLIPDSIWNDINSTFLEPACGNGNFLIEILHRKILKCKTDNDIVLATKSIYGIDLLEDNVKEARARMLDIIKAHLHNEKILIKIKSILNKNIIIGDALAIMKDWEEKGEKSEN